MERRMDARKEGSRAREEEREREREREKERERVQALASIVIDINSWRRWELEINPKNPKQSKRIPKNLPRRSTISFHQRIGRNL